MALSGSKSVTVTEYNTLKFSWSATQSISGNYSNVSWKLTLSSTKYGAISSSASKDWSVKVNGNSYSGSNTVRIGASTTKTLASGTTKVPHNGDGTKTFSFSFSQEFNIYFNGNVGTKSGSGSATLNTIPRASSLTVPTINFGDAGTLTISRASSSFTHTIKVDFGAYEKTVATKTTATSVSFTPPLTWANAIPNKTSGECVYTIQTYNGSTLIGTKTKTGTLKLLAADAKPTISGIALTKVKGNAQDTFTEYVRTISEVKVTTNASGKYGATIKKYQVTIGSSEYAATSSNTLTSGLNTAGNRPITVTVTDSRGYTNSSSTSVTVTDYDEPTITGFSAFRCDSGGTEADDGIQAKCTVKYNVSPINNKNGNTWTIRARKEGDTTWSNLLNGSGYSVNTSQITSAFFNVDYPYEIELSVSDTFKTVSKIIQIPTAFTLVDYHSTGKGIAFGKVATTQDLFDVNFPALFNKKVNFQNESFDKFGTRINNGLVKYTGSGANAINPDTTLDELILTDSNTPWNGFAYIRTIFYGAKTTTSARYQIAYPYNKKGSHATRYYYGEAWSDWEGADTGWKSLTLSTNWTRTSDEYVAYRARNGWVDLRFYVIARLDIPAASKNYMVATGLPKAYQPATYSVRATVIGQSKVYAVFIPFSGSADAGEVQFGGNNIDKGYALRGSIQYVL